MLQPIDFDLSQAVLDVAHELFPAGFDVSEEAPNTFEELKAHLRASGRMLVYSGASDATIFGPAFVNHAFRAWHDWVHYTFDLPFTPQGERRAWSIQCDMLAQRYGENTLVAYWRKLLDAEINGQLRYAARHKGSFPVNQRGFVQAYLLNRNKAVKATF